MKIKILFSILIFINAIFNIYAGKINEEKSFDEIFGQKWDEKEEENGENENDQNGTIGQTDGQNVTKNDQIFDENLEMKEESARNCDQLEQMHFSNAIDKKKREIVKKFHRIKEKIKQMGKKYSTKEWVKIERKIAKKLGVSQEKIYKWKREFGLIKNRYSDEERRKMLKQFDQIYAKLKMKLNGKLEGKRTKCQKIIAKHLGTNISSINRWKKEIKDGKSFINQKNDYEKRKIIQKYLEIKNKFMKNGKRKEWNEFTAKIKQIFGVHNKTIKRWANKIGINQNYSKVRNFYSIVEKKMLNIPSSLRDIKKCIKKIR